MAETDQVAIVTGASRGIGRATATTLAARGPAVVVNYAGSAAEAEDVVGAIGAAGGRARAVRADVAGIGHVRRVFDEAGRAFGGVDVLVNNAGVMQTGPLAAVDDAQFERHFAVNVRGTFHGRREAATRLRDGGRIVNVSSAALAVNLPGYAVYNATKAAVEAFTRVFAEQMGPRGITVNAVRRGRSGRRCSWPGRARPKSGASPRWPRSAGLAGSAARRTSPRWWRSSPRPRGGWTNGQVVRVDGGR